jgi:hypothetical protein
MLRILVAHLAKAAWTAGLTGAVSSAVAVGACGGVRYHQRDAAAATRETTAASDKLVDNDWRLISLSLSIYIYIYTAGLCFPGSLAKPSFFKTTATTAATAATTTATIFLVLGLAR